MRSWCRRRSGGCSDRTPTSDPGIFRVPRGHAPQFDYSRDGVLRSVEESLNRLGLDRLDVVLVHDPDDHEQEALEGAFPALLELRDQGVVRAIGSGMNQSEMLARFVDRIDLDCVLLAGRYTLLDRSGAELLDTCAARGVGVIIGGVFNSGILARVDADATFDYEPASGAIRERAGRARSSLRAPRGPSAGRGAGLRAAEPGRERGRRRCPERRTRSATTSPGPSRRSRSRCATSSTRLRAVGERAPRPARCCGDPNRRRASAAGHDLLQHEHRRIVTRPRRRRRPRCRPRCPSSRAPFRATVVIAVVGVAATSGRVIVPAPFCVMAYTVSSRVV